MATATAPESTVRERELSDGSVLTFEHYPVGTPTKKGEPRKVDWRAYHLTPVGGERRRLISVTTILDAICPKGALPRWAEARGIEGAVEAVRIGEIDPHTVEPEAAIDRVRALRLGADRARDEAAGRGLNIHALLEDYLRTGSAPSLADHPAEHAGYIQAFVRWLLHANPEPEAIEELVCSPEDGYAGRLDLVARHGPLRIMWDAKTQAKGGIYDGAHCQLKLYERAYVRCGGEPPDLRKVVVFAEDGAYREMECAATDRTVEAALDWWRELAPVTSSCESANRVERKARA